MSNRRIEILKNAALLRSLGGSAPDFLRNLLAPPCQILGKRRIARVEPVKNGMVAVYIKGVARPLYLPAEIKRDFLYQVLAEEMYKWNWHNYQAVYTPIEKDDVVLDCGAAEGLFSLLASEKEAKQVICIEPHPEYIRALGHTFEGLANITLVAAAVGSELGHLHLSNDGIASVITEESEGTIPVKIETLDHLCSSLNIRPTFIKADIEGYEEQMLMGAEEIIAACHPKLALTTYHRASAGGWIEAFLKRINPKYNIQVKGLSGRRGATVMLHAWN